MVQLDLLFARMHGGARVGAGCPLGTRRSECIAHARRPAVSRHRPHHVTVRAQRHTWNLRSQRCFTPIARALRAVRRERDGFRVIQFSVQHNHLHLIVEAEDRRTLTNALKSLLIRIALGINRVMRAKGPRLADRYHEHILATPTETRNALIYVLGNRGVHLARWGKRGEGDDPFCSLANEDTTKSAASWLLRVGWARAGP